MERYLTKRNATRAAFLLFFLIGLLTVIPESKSPFSDFLVLTVTFLIAYYFTYVDFDIVEKIDPIKNYRPQPTIDSDLKSGIIKRIQLLDSEIDKKEVLLESENRKIKSLVKYSFFDPENDLRIENYNNIFIKKNSVKRYSNIKTIQLEKIISPYKYSYNFWQELINKIHFSLTSETVQILDKIELSDTYDLERFRPKPIDIQQYHTKVDGLIDFLFGDQIRKSEKARLAQDQADYQEKVKVYEGSEIYSINWFKSECGQKIATINDKIAYHNDRASKFNRDLESAIRGWKSDFEAISKKLKSYVDNYEKGSEQDVSKYFSFVLRMSPYPEIIPRNIDVIFDEKEKVLLVELELPNLRDRVITTLNLNREKPLSAKDQDLLHRKIQASIVARTFHEIEDFDFLERVDGICINGKMFYIDKSDGHEKSSYVVSAFAKRSQVSGINIERVDPQIFLEGLKARISARFDPSIAVLPILSFDKSDRRVRENDFDIDEFDGRQNLASMDWEDFEKLVAILFSKIFPSETAEVKVTQASRDRGVDAIVWDTDPIKGGKFIIQAKRYTNTVDVAAVRDLYGTLVDEGANRGILVTTSSFGPDSISWAKDKPITLIGGTELLGLFERYNYNFRIDLEEARKLNRG